jgi:hypothetical protein
VRTDGVLKGGDRYALSVTASRDVFVYVRLGGLDPLGTSGNGIPVKVAATERLPASDYLEFPAQPKAAKTILALLASTTPVGTEVVTAEIEKERIRKDSAYPCPVGTQLSAGRGETRGNTNGGRGDPHVSRCLDGRGVAVLIFPLDIAP